MTVTDANTHIIVDMLYDFIDGSLACCNAENAVDEAFAYMNEHPEMEVLYVMDHHPAKHCSFKENGGTWPVHCVAGTHGGDVHNLFYHLENEDNRPCLENEFFKGCDPAVEQYSGYEAKNINGIDLGERVSEAVVVSGIATEYCVRATCEDLLKAGHKVYLYVNALAYVDAAGHERALRELEQEGVVLI